MTLSRCYCSNVSNAILAVSENVLDFRLFNSNIEEAGVKHNNTSSNTQFRWRVETRAAEVNFSAQLVYESLLRPRPRTPEMMAATPDAPLALSRVGSSN